MQNITRFFLVLGFFSCLSYADKPKDSYIQWLNSPDSRLHSAFILGNTKNAEKALAQKANINNHNPILETVPLHDAVTYEQPEMVSFAINNAADVNKQDHIGKAPLHTVAGKSYC